jgi:hypothetical protein
VAKQLVASRVVLSSGELVLMVLTTIRTLHYHFTVVRYAASTVICILFID